MIITVMQAKLEIVRSPFHSFRRRSKMRTSRRIPDGPHRTSGPLIVNIGLKFPESPNTTKRAYSISTRIFICETKPLTDNAVVCIREHERHRDLDAPKQDVEPVREDHCTPNGQRSLAGETNRSALHWEDPELRCSHGVVRSPLRRRILP